MKGTINVYASEWEHGWELSVFAPGVPSDRDALPGGRVEIGKTQHEAGDDPEPIVREFVAMNGYDPDDPIRIYYVFDDGAEQVAEWPARAYAPAEPVSSPWWLLTKLVQIGLTATALLIIWAVLEISFPGSR